MDLVHYAAIDIGSNAVRLVIKRLDDPSNGYFSKVVVLRVPLRLGQDAFTIGEISEKKIHDLKELMRSYAIVMKLYDVKKSNFRACATAAMREARNAGDVIDYIRRKIDMDIDIIPGTEEASILCAAHMSHCDSRNMVYVDVGGGSTEVSVIADGEMVSTKSYAIGTLRILNDTVDIHVCDDLIHDMQLIAIDYPHSTIVGAGGNISKLFDIAEERDAERQRLSPAMLHKLYNELASMSIEQRVDHFKLKPDRADVIVPAAHIFLTIADALGAVSIEVPSVCLSDGIIEDIYRKQQNGTDKKWF